MPPVNRTMGPLEWGLLLALSILWGGSFFFGQVALAELRPFTVVLARVGIAAVALWIIAALVGEQPPQSARCWGRYVVMGAINNLVPFSLLLWSQTRIASSLASILNATTPVFTVLLAHFLTRDERMTPGRVGGVIAGLVGVLVMVGPEALRGFGDDLTAELIALGAPISYAFAGIYGRRFRGDPPLVTAAGQVTATTLMILPIALVFDRPWELTSIMPATLGALLGTALLSTALGYVIFFRILATAGATNLLLVTFLIPASALVLGMSVLGERLEAMDVAGMACIGLGLALIDGRLVTWFGRFFRDGSRGPASSKEIS
jgi:drug/metabolite transporter (DMT)-like permease